MRMPLGVPWRWTLDPDEIGDCLKKEMDVKMSGSTSMQSCNQGSISQDSTEFPYKLKYHLPAG